LDEEDMFAGEENFLEFDNEEDNFDDEEEDRWEEYEFEGFNK
jgi:hypothetical protein